MKGQYILALDEGSSSARAILVNHNGQIVSDASQSFDAVFPHPGWVELKPEELWGAMQSSITRVMNSVSATAADITAVGITSHRETCLIWDRKSGEPVYNALMWMSKQTDDIIRGWSEQGLDKRIKNSTGLRNDSFFSAGKLAWLFQNVEGLRSRAERGELAAGTPDTWLLWNLTAGSSHATDRGAGSRTMLLNLESGQWDFELADALNIPTSVLPKLIDSDGDFGNIAAGILPGPMTHKIPIRAILGDQQAGLFGQLCWDRGDAKNSYGTAGVLTVNVGSKPVLVKGMNTSFSWQRADEPRFQSEGVVFHSGKTIQFLRDNFGMIADAAQTQELAESVKDTGGVYFVPGFAGLGDPYWDRSARGAILGLQLDSTKAHLIRAGLESVAYQTYDNLESLSGTELSIPALKVDGGAVKNSWLCQFQADILGIEVQRPTEIERTAIGVAQMAGLGVGLWTERDVKSQWQLERSFEPQISDDMREFLISGWKDAVAVTRSLPAAKLPPN